MATKKKTTKKTSHASATNLAICYLPLVGWIPAAVFMVLETDRKIRWHAMQALLLNGVAAVAVLLTAGSALGFALVAFVLVLMVVLAVRVYRGEDLSLPILSGWTEMIVHKG